MAMKCFRCQRDGVESIMIKENGWARCPRCGRTVSYKTNAERRMESEANSNLSCMNIIVFIPVILITRLIARFISWIVRSLRNGIEKVVDKIENRR